MTTLTRKIDSLSRVTLPSKYRKTYSLKVGSAIELTIEFGAICIRPFDNENIADRAFIGVVRYLDTLGRVTIPAEYMQVLNLNSPMECCLSWEDSELVLSKLEQ